jgi:Holliday junction resolvasome RuvABC endonuclease subunit
MVAQLLRLARAPEPADAADGVAIALTHLLVAGRRAGARPLLGAR